MIFIGEKINGTRKKIKEAVIERNELYIMDIAKSQAESGADYLDINAGTDPDRETEDLIWLIETVQSVVDTPICIDSSTPSAIKAALEIVREIPMINSINADMERLDDFLPFIKEKNCEVIALALDESKSGMPKTIDERMQALEVIFKETHKKEIDDDKVFIDPLIMAVGTDQSAGNIAFDCIREIRSAYPDAHIAGGLSNISFGLPNRSLINRTFLTLARAFGMDSAVVNPSDVELIESLYATDLLLGKDRFCRKYTNAAKDSFSKKK
ncbi:dihydropteroate synthase [Alkalibacter mobilis]|uniref:dihydropteroate synthase n=1 Tax=Alkalibacter mobilis TaxID=2787712 RepID=UPI0018A098DD|nr:dihydropteroate synthase [Alkalibacter mobilis]MBF7097246.1 dihydropteroate synthase [Alkalibacter mobilis]